MKELVPQKFIRKKLERGNHGKFVPSTFPAVWYTLCISVTVSFKNILHPPSSPPLKRMFAKNECHKVMFNSSFIGRKNYVISLCSFSYMYVYCW